MNLFNKYRHFLINISLIISTLLVSVFILEIVYRYQLLDFYKAEFTFLNQKVLTKKKKKTVLVFGDSFTATPNGYVSILNNYYDDIQFINAAVPGFGAQEINIISKKRINETNPDFVLIQLYVGNDLLDIAKPINWSTIAFTRNCYWLITNRFLSLRFVNYRLGQIKQNLGLNVESQFLKNEDAFSLEKFSKREVLLLQANPSFYEQSIFVNDVFKQRFNLYLKQLSVLTAFCKQKNINLKIVVVPSACQVHHDYKARLTLVGAKWSNHQIYDTTYPFVELLRKYFKDENLPILNPLSNFQDAENRGVRIYFDNDIHLNMKGDSVLANFLKPYF